MEMPEATHSDIISRVGMTCLRALRSDGAWQKIGYSKRPRVGSFFQRFRPAWKVNLDIRVAETMLAALTAAHAAAGKIRYDQASEVVAWYIVQADLARMLGYATPDECFWHLSNSIAEYRETPVEAWSDLIFRQMAPNAIPDRKFRDQVLPGCIRFSEIVKKMVVHSKRENAPS